MNLKLFNTSSRKKEEFTTQNSTVGMYCCGPTVYNYAHIGNLRTYIFEDVLKKVLQYSGYSVNHIMNITDVGHLVSDADTGEDKMEKGAEREGKSVWDLAEYYTSKFFENIKELNIVSPDKAPKATDHIAQMISMIQTLEKKGFTYITSDGVYFDTVKFPSYCDFAGLDPSALRAGERVDMGEKRAVTDFALWKFSPLDQKRQMEWDSPWGVGFPGWHIECSAMSLAYLSQPVDIHCGGADHVRVHHTNEIAQTEAATGNKFVHYWLHGEFLVLDKSKMAKSGGNFVTLDVVKREGLEPLAYRMFCYSAHYRSPLTFSWEGLKASAQSLQNLRKSALLIKDDASSSAFNAQSVGNALKEFGDAISDDLNMPRAMAAVWDVLKKELITPADKFEALKRMDSVLSLDIFKVPVSSSVNELVEGPDGLKIKFVSSKDLDKEFQIQVVHKISARKSARKNRDFAEADRLRDELVAAGVSVKDLPDGTIECTLD